MGHFQVLDQKSFLQASACSSGKVDEAAVRATCRQLLLDWVGLSVEALDGRGLDAERVPADSPLQDLSLAVGLDAVVQRPVLQQRLKAACERGAGGSSGLQWQIMTT